MGLFSQRLEARQDVAFRTTGNASAGRIPSKPRQGSVQNLPPDKMSRDHFARSFHGVFSQQCAGHLGAILLRLFRPAARF